MEAILRPCVVVDHRIRYLVGGKVWPMMPDEPLNHAMFDRVVEAACNRFQGFNLNSSISGAWSHHITIPPSLPIPDLTQRQRESYQKSRRIIERFAPVEMHDVVIGSNEGLLTFLAGVHHRILSDDYKGHYQPHVFDVNIFERTLKAMYDKKVASSALRDRMPILLGVWHPVKHLMELVWRRFGPILFAPMTHFIWPGTNYYDKPRTIRFHIMYALCAAASKTILPHIQDSIDILESEVSPALPFLLGP